MEHEAFKSWKQLYSRWCRTRSRALRARCEANIALLKCAYGAGPPPTRRQLDKVRRLEDDAEMLRLEMDGTILSMVVADFGSASTRARRKVGDPPSGKGDKRT